MSQHELQRLIGTAAINPRFCEALLRGSRREAISEFALEPEERAIVLSIQAETLQEFASILGRRLRGGAGEP